MTRAYIDTPRGHVWACHESGAVDIFGYHYGNHNGPVCVNCGYGFCHHCQKSPSIDCPAPAKKEAAIANYHHAGLPDDSPHEY